MTTCANLCIAFCSQPLNVFLLYTEERCREMESFLLYTCEPALHKKINHTINDIFVMLKKVCFIRTDRRKFGYILFRYSTYWKVFRRLLQQVTKIKFHWNGPQFFYMHKKHDRKTKNETWTIIVHKSISWLEFRCKTLNTYNYHNHFC